MTMTHSTATSVCWNFLVAHARPPMPGMPSTVSAATIVVQAKPTARRMPVNSSGSTDGQDDVARRTWKRLAPSARAASMRSRADRCDAARRPTSAIGANGGEEQQPDLRRVLDAEPDDQQAEVGERRQAADEVDVRLERRPGTARTVASSSPSGTPTTIAQASPFRIRHRLAQRCSHR